MNKIFLAVIFAFIPSLIFSSASVWGATITVDDSGGKDHTTIQAALNAASGGDTIEVYSGTYGEDIDSVRSGSDGNLITIKAADGESPVLDGSGQSGYLIYIQHDYIVWDGIDVQNGPSSCFWVVGDYNQIKNTVVTTCGGNSGGIVIRSGNYNQVVDVEVSDAYNGVEVADAENTLIQGGYYHDCPHTCIDMLPYPSRDPQLIWSGNDIIGNIAARCNNGIYVRYQDDFLIANNVSYEHQDMGIYITSHTSLPPSSWDANGKIYGNTFVDNGDGNGIMNDAGYNIDYHNNIFAYNSNYDLYVTSTAATNSTANYNLYYDSVQVGWQGSNYYSVAAFNSGKGHEANGVSGDPSFTNRTSDDYSVQSDSEAIDVGEDLSEDYTDDFLGVTRPQNSIFDIGAYEFDTGDSDVPPLTIQGVSIQ